MTTLEIILIAVLAYILIGMIATTLVIVLDGDNTMFIDEMWIGIFLWWFALIVNGIRKYFQKRRWEQYKEKQKKCEN